MVAVLGLMYLRRSERVYDPLRKKVIQHALQTDRERPPAGSLADNGSAREEVRR